MACLSRQGIPPGTLLRTANRPRIRLPPPILSGGCPEIPTCNPVMRLEINICEQGPDRWQSLKTALADIEVLDHPVERK